MTAPFRIEPVAPVQAYRTFSLVRPRQPDFWRAASCEQVSCPRWRNGWRTVLDLGTRDGLRWAEWIARRSGRRWTKEQAGNQVTFTFEAGQSCFEKHRVPRERDPLFIMRGGDHRGNPTGERRRHTRGEDWRDDMQENLARVAEDRKRG